MCLIFWHDWTDWEKVIYKTIWHDPYFGSYEKTTVNLAERRTCRKCEQIQERNKREHNI